MIVVQPVRNESVLSYEARVQRRQEAERDRTERRAEAARLREIRRAYVTALPEAQRLQIIEQNLQRRRGRFGQILVSPWVTTAQEQARVQAIQQLRAEKEEAEAARHAREELIEEHFEQEVVAPTRQPTTAIEAQAAQRATQLRAEQEFQEARKRFNKAMLSIPYEYSQMFAKLIQHYNGYESLPGYREFAAGRIGIRDMIPAVQEQYKRLVGEEEAAEEARAEAWETKHDIIEMEIEAEQEAKRLQQQEREREVMLKRQIQAEEERARKAAQAAEKALEEQIRKEREEIARQEAKQRAAAERAAHPQLPGSPPVTAAIIEITARMGIAPGAMAQAAFDQLFEAVYNRARQLSPQFYYYTPQQKKKQYSTAKSVVRAMLNEEGYTVEPVYTIQPVPMQPTPELGPSYPDPRIPGAYSAEAVQQRAAIQAAQRQQTIAQQQAAPVYQPAYEPAPAPVYTPPATATYATQSIGPDDPMIQEAIDLVLTQNRMRSGHIIGNIAAFQGQVVTQAEGLSSKYGRTARPEHVTAAVDSRMRFVLKGLSSL